MPESKPYPISPLEDLVEVLDHLRAPVNSEDRSLRPGTIPYYGATGLQGWIDEALTNEPLILLAEDGGNFDAFADRPIAYRIDGPAWVNNHAHIIRAKPGVSQSFVFWSIAHKDIRRFIAGGTRTKLTQSEMRRIEVPLPAPPEQTQIAAVLDTLDTTIRQTEAIIAKLKQVKQGLLHDLLTRGIDANGELRPPQSEAPHLYKASPLGWIPLTWHAIHMHEAIRELSQGWSPDCETEAAGSDAWGVLKTTSIVWEGYSDQENKALPSTFAPRPELEVLPHDILITRAGPKERVAVVAYVEQTRQRLMISDKMYRLRLRASDVPAYFALALSSEYAQGAIKRTISGMADSQTNISQPVIRSLEVMRPPTDEQREIAQRVAAFDARLDAEQRYVHASTSLKSGLMDDLLTGRVRVTPLLAQAQATQP